MTDIELKSEAGVDYSGLRDLLKSQSWQEADVLTLSLMKTILPFDQTQNNVGDMSKFPCADLQTINQLWVTFSQGHFGFSVQKEIWENLGENLDAEDLPLDKNEFFNNDFASQVGWKVGNVHPSLPELTFSLDAPKGELPASWVNSDSVVAANSNIYKAWKRLQTCPPVNNDPPPAQPDPSTSPPSVSPKRLDQGTTELRLQLEKELNYRKRHFSQNRSTYLYLSISSIVFTCLATIFGIIGNIDSGRDNVEDAVANNGGTPTILGLRRTDYWKFLTPICSTIAATLQGALLGFPVQQRAKLHRSLEAEADSLKSELELQRLLDIDTQYLKDTSKKLTDIKKRGSDEDAGTNQQVATLTQEQINSMLTLMATTKAELSKLKEEKEEG